MIEKIMKAVKSSNKRRGRNITIGAVIGFLLSCTAVMGATSDKYLWIEKDDKDGACTVSKCKNGNVCRNHRIILRHKCLLSAV